MIQRAKEQAPQVDLLTVMTCGSVDDGKSTLIGRLLWDSNQVYEDQKQALIKDSERYGTQGSALDYALLVDGLSAEREQGITIDIAYRYFTSQLRKFVLTDTPGHEQYTRNMITAASHADVGIVLVDAQKGIISQTQRHIALLAMMRVPHIILSINKMDCCHHSQAVYAKITATFLAHIQSFSFQSVHSVPIVAIHGDNIVHRSAQMDWYGGSTLLGYLETLDRNISNSDHVIFPVQWVNRYHTSFRGYAGTLVSGKLQCHDAIRLIRTGEVARVTKIIHSATEAPQASAQQAITICLDRDIDVSRGDVFTLKNQPLDSSDTFTANLVWMGVEPGYSGRSYLLKIGHTSVRAQIVTLKHKIDVTNQAELSANDIQCNDIVKVVIRCAERIAYTPYTEHKALGAFILIDPLTKHTIAAGTIDFSMRRAANVHRQALTVQRTDRAILNGHKGLAIWLTGLSGSGKSTIANSVEKALHAKGIRTYILDGDNVRQGICKDLGFTQADRIENIRRVAEIAHLMVDAGLVVLVATISPYAADRAMARDTIGTEQFFEVFVNTPLEICERRDPKGLYKKARQGKLPGFTGIDSPYETPELPDWAMRSSDEECAVLVEKVLGMV